ncbi:hypothetical protein THJ003_01390 [Campylobacter jejuni]|nr:restriction endonuclease [Campylobacter jejuni]BDL61670.1 hypothetical protein THJ001_01390 [Campylobacter jejuni]BDL63418.1 hypothetical protein THJ003_01390 [Campylobacter jejuni]BDL65165.1 hypothetical protein THJ004_01380 [Campylobacter jejuni]BDL83814.1 hypothetical protein THJ033_01390 [Campylobacter jejuni]
MFAYACKFKIYDIKLVYPLCEKTQDLQRKIAEKFFVFKASEHLYFKEQGQKDIKVQVVIRTFTFLKISLSNALKNQNKLQL